MPVAIHGRSWRSPLVEAVACYVHGHVVFRRSQAQGPRPLASAPGTRRRRCPSPRSTRCSARRSSRRSRPRCARVTFGMGCFWGAEKKFWQLPGVYSTQVGYAGGATPNPTYREVCSGGTGHTEVVRVVYDPAKVSSKSSCACSGRTTTRRRACARATTSARSTARASTSRATTQKRIAEASRDDVPGRSSRRRGTARSRPRSRRSAEFFYAEDYHQQYLAKNPDGYCGIGRHRGLLPGRPGKRAWPHAGDVRARALSPVRACAAGKDFAKQWKSDGKRG